MRETQIHDKTFREMITEGVIADRIKELALQINNELNGKDVVFVWHS